MSGVTANSALCNSFPVQTSEREALVAHLTAAPHFFRGFHCACANDGERAV